MTNQVSCSFSETVVTYKKAFESNMLAINIGVAKQRNSTVTQLFYATQRLTNRK